MNKSYIFTECFNSGKIARVALESFLSHHTDVEINVFGTENDFKELANFSTNPLVVLNTINDNEIIESFKKGHRGTAMVFALACNIAKNMKYDTLIHFDADVFFKKESIYYIESLFEKGYDAIGTRRCYKNNPSGVLGLDNIPDSISTYFMGINLKKIHDFTFNQLVDMWQGAWHPKGWTILDFGDPVIHSIINNNGKVYFLEPDLFGGQQKNGSKQTHYPLNMHMDCGEYLIHFGGVSSGYAYYKGKSNPEKSYAEWSLGRYSLFCKVFFNEEITVGKPIVYKEESNMIKRWVDGNFDEEILRETVKEVYG